MLYKKMTARRHIIAVGVPTAGKTTFAHELTKRFALEHIQTDRVVTAFERAFPELGITHDAGRQDLARHLAVCERFKPFLFALIDDLTRSDFIIEGFRMPAEEIMKQYGKTRQVFVFGYPNTTAQERVALCRKFDTNNWTNGVSDDDLNREFTYLIEESRRLERLAAQYNLPFIDASKGKLSTVKQALRLVQ